ncbi:TPA: hypothetical protein RQK39_000723 [Vibrio vulnificus]|uniref:hypothetical protein n=1 Tax=Vibrio vulnificus TaxID=672 RepID=UPI0005F1D98A|nr:hypothetical protein [Vibrio vulnificus]ANN29154.1 hypothetical protein FORC17_4091 [Vibrio vulnificus]RZP90723.1 hypothetical protein D8T54_18480 [Vibrio vulnificus]HAS6370625.1 hypothetical protein [Vibrio vulnificus]HAT8507976.1 hypothetical protein [Vibrio vulnificus]HDY7628329.1 hypothetical protein [Vibrio vulnificus]
MINWKLISVHNEDEVVHDLTSISDAQINIRETSNIQFLVSVDEQSFEKLGHPHIVLSDIPLELEFSHYDGTDRNFRTTEEFGSHSSRYFYNFFGESEVSLCFEKENSLYHSQTINILARRDNAQLANEMLSYITNHLDDAVSICFSRSKLSVGYDDSKNFNFSRLDIIQSAVSYLTEAIPMFVREHKYTWKPELELSEQGQPTGPDSVHWVLTNLDIVSPSSIDEANLLYNNRGYRLDLLPKENIIKDRDVFENRVIHTFLHNIMHFLYEIKEQLSIKSSTDDALVDQEYVRFDHTMRQYTQLALDHKSNQIDALILSVEQLKRIFSTKIPAKTQPGIQPKLTSYVVRHPHYRKTFGLIEKCYKAPAPTFEGANLLLGLKNLSIVYETASLLIVHETIKTCFDVQLSNQCYKEHGEQHPFGGVERQRPQGETNNHFSYKSEAFDIELLYEPKIYPFSSSSTSGDLVDTSLSRRNEYGAHHYSPDFVLKIESRHWHKPVTIVLDSKYKDASTIRRFDIDSLTRKYLLNIHQVNSQGRLGVSPINLLLLMFPHDKSGTIVRTVSPKHCLNGQYPVLPQATAILVKPTEHTLLKEHLLSILEIMNAERRLTS